MDDNSYNIEKLKREIDKMVDDIAKGVKRENEYLKKRVAFLENENLRLNAILYGEKRRSAVKYFIKDTDKHDDLIN